MSHCYILDYSCTEIDHITIPDNIEMSDEIEDYLHSEFGYNEDEIHYMVADKELEINNIN